MRPDLAMTQTEVLVIHESVRAPRKLGLVTQERDCNSGNRVSASHERTRVLCPGGGVSLGGLAVVRARLAVARRHFAGASLLDGENAFLRHLLERPGTESRGLGRSRGPGSARRRSSSAS